MGICGCSGDAGHVGEESNRSPLIVQTFLKSPLTQVCGVATLSPLSVAPRPTMDPIPSGIHPPPPPVPSKGRDPPSSQLPFPAMHRAYSFWDSSVLCSPPPPHLYYNASLLPEISLPQVLLILEDPEKVLPPKSMSTELGVGIIGSLVPLPPKGDMALGPPWPRTWCPAPHATRIPQPPEAPQSQC